MITYERPIYHRFEFEVPSHGELSMIVTKDANKHTFEYYVELETDADYKLIESMGDDFPEVIPDDFPGFLSDKSSAMGNYGNGKGFTTFDDALASAVATMISAIREAGIGVNIAEVEKLLKEYGIAVA